MSLGFSRPPRLACPTPGMRLLPIAAAPAAIPRGIRLAQRPHMPRLLLAPALFLLFTSTGCPPASLPADQPDLAGVDGGDPRDGASIPGPDLGSPPDARNVEPRLVAASRDGRLASLDLVAPWTVR